MLASFPLPEMASSIKIAFPRPVNSWLTSGGWKSLTGDITGNQNLIGKRVLPALSGPQYKHIICTATFYLPLWVVCPHQHLSCLKLKIQGSVCFHAGSDFLNLTHFRCIEAAALRISNPLKWAWGRGGWSSWIKRFLFYFLGLWTILAPADMEGL